MNIYVGNLARTVTEDALRQLFSQKGEVSSVKIIVDKFTGEKRGFGFVDMRNDAEARQAIADLNNQEFEGMTLKVNEAREREPRTGGGYRPGGNRFGNSGGGSRFGGGNDRGGNRFGGSNGGRSGFGGGRSGGNGNGWNS